MEEQLDRGGVVCTNYTVRESKSYVHTGWRRERRGKKQKASTALVLLLLSGVGRDPFVGEDIVEPLASGAIIGFLDREEPAVGVGDVTALDTNDGVVEALRDRANLAPANNQMLPIVDDLTHGGDAGGSAGTEDFREAPITNTSGDLVHGEGLFHGRDMEILADGKDAISGDAGKDRPVRERGRVDLPVLDKHHVHGTNLLNKGASLRVEPEDLAAADLVGELHADQRGGIITSALDVTSATRGSTNVITRNEDLDAFKPIRIVRTDSACNRIEGVLAARANTKNSFRADHGGTEVEGSAGHVRNVTGVSKAKSLEALQHCDRINLRHAKAKGGLVEPDDIAVSTEDNHLPISGTPETLHSLKNFLRIVEDDGGGMEAEIVQLLHGGNKPLATLVTLLEHVISKELAEGKAAGIRDGSLAILLGDLVHNDVLRHGS